MLQAIRYILYMPIQYDHDHENEINFFALTNFRSQRRKFGIKTDDRRRHMYVLGKTGMGKTTMLENMIINDINAGHGVAVVDPHGDTANKLLDYIPSHRVNDVIYFNPADHEYPVAFNVLETVNPLHKHLVAQGLMGVFKKIWPDVWSARMEHILNNCILALLDYPGSTLLGINRLLVDKLFRRRVIAKIRDPIVKAFWVDEYAAWESRFRNEAIQPIQNKVGQFLSASLIRNIVAQVKSTIDMRSIMDSGKIFIMDLSKGRLGEDTSRLLGGMIITKMQLAAMERVDIPELERRDFYLYVDEFQNFATESFANILSEARKYRLDLIVAHQYIGQLVTDASTKMRDAIFGNVGTIVMFRIGAEDAEFVAKEFAPQFIEEDMVNLTKYDIYLKLMIDGVTSNPFSAQTMSPIAEFQGQREKIVRVSRERYAAPAALVEDKIMKWAGMEESDEGLIDVSSSEEGEWVKPLTFKPAPKFKEEGRPFRQEPSAKPKIQETVPAPVAAPAEAPRISLQDLTKQKPVLIKLSPPPIKKQPQPPQPTIQPAVRPEVRDGSKLGSAQPQHEPRPGGQPLQEHRQKPQQQGMMHRQDREKQHNQRKQHEPRPPMPVKSSGQDQQSHSERVQHAGHSQPHHEQPQASRSPRHEETPHHLRPGEIVRLDKDDTKNENTQN
ncbi:MAG: hypothetical protein UX17_C0005G0009 [Parcubacteria group bacterium GW2011_GWC2_45_7]|nr:MAG: hypothetical protein UX17_C0005G0009 [Parcubacteria group bacterium GW2011_GWC2_45_7]